MERRVRFATASTKNQGLLRDLGVDEPIDYSSSESKNRRNIDIVSTRLAPKPQERSWSVLKKGGVLVSLVSRRRRRKPKNSGVRLRSLARNEWRAAR